MATRLVSIPREAVPQFDELYAISDLHLGGEPGFQIFDAGAELAALAAQLRSRARSRRVALVINGDMVDFLAERPATYFDPQDAVRKLRDIAAREAFAPVFEGLRAFAGTKNCTLAITLGNHDLELALPWVREALLELLSGGDAAARGRILLAFDGAGLRCRVGEATVLCVHGNEVDLWNLTDHERIRRIGMEVQQGRPVPAWIPNAGTQLVIDAMNDIKTRFPFVDLLKPETQAVVPTLLALEPDQRARISAAAASVLRRERDRVRRAAGLLGEEEEAARAVALSPGASVFPPRTPPASGAPVLVAPAHERREVAELLLAETERRLAGDMAPMELVAEDERGGQLGIGAALFGMVRRQDRRVVLREALQKLRQDRGFEPTTEDQTYRDLDRQVGAEVDFLLTGHTHLQRALPRRHAPGRYFNSGTWVRLIRLDDARLDSQAAFDEVYEAFEKGTMQALDAVKGLVLRRRGVVAIRAEGGATRGELLNAALDGEGKIALEPAASAGER